MTRKSSFYKNEALERLRNNWTKPVIVSTPYLIWAILHFAVIGAKTSIQMSTLNTPDVSLAPLLSILLLEFADLFLVIAISGVSIWATYTFQDLYNGKSDWSSLKNDGNFFRYVVCYILQGFVVLCWSLLLIIPGIVKSLAYSQTFYILRENPQMSPWEAMKESEKMMAGHKTDMFIFGLSFIGWVILVPFTLGIGYLFFVPYVLTSYASYYENLKKEYYGNNTTVNA